MRRPTTVRSLGAVIATVAVSLALAACGNSSDASSGDGDNTGSSPEAQAAAAAIADVLKPATETNVPESLDEAPPKGKTFVYLSCESDQCAYGAKVVKNATDALGWDVKVIQYKNADPKSLIAAMDQALQYDPIAVSFFALPEALWKQQVPVYEKAGVTLIPISVGDVTFSKTVPTNISTKTQGLATGEAIANWVIADSDAKANILFFNVPAFATLNPFVEGFKATVAKGCEGCKITDLEATIDQVGAGKVNDLIVSALQRNPDVDYVVTSGGTLIHGLPSALNAAGIKVTLAGGSATVEEQEYIRAGNPAAFVSYPLEQFVWQAVDAAARVSVGVEPPKDYGVSPFQVLTEESITDVPSGVSYDFPKDFRDQYKKAWQVR